jgi:hypothetical protein
MRQNYNRGIANAGVSRVVSGYSPRSYGLGGRNYGARGGYYAPGISQPYYSTNGYSQPQDPYGGYLSGASDAIQAQGQFQVQQQEANLKKQQVEQAKIQTRRKSFDQYLYERDKRPTAEDDREKARLERVRRARNQPPPGEIQSGQALNVLLDSIQKMQKQNIPGPTIPLQTATLERINVTAGAQEGSLGVLKDGGQLRWPLVIRGSAFKSERQKFDKMAVQAYQQANQGMVDADLINQMTETLDTLTRNMRSKIASISANDYIRSKRYLNDLSKTLRVLDDPNVGKFATRKWSARGDNVEILVMNMTRDGLKFAPATQGGEASYTSLHSSMVAYYTLPASGQPWDPMAK